MSHHVRRIGLVAGTVLAVALLVTGTVIAQGPRESADATPSDATAAPAPHGDPVATETFLPGTAFHGEDSNAVFRHVSGGCLDIAEGDVVTATLDLPHGTTVTAVTAHVFDAEPGNAVDVRLERYATDDTTSGATPRHETIHSIDSEDAGDDSGYQTLTDTTADPSEAATIDLGTWTYAVIALGSANPTDLCGVRITHRGAATAALTFHQTDACAAFDSRSGRGGREAPLASGASATFDLVMDDYGSQGGTSDTSSCDLPAARGMAPNGTVAVLINLVAISPAKPGNLQLWDADEDQPAGGVLVYDPKHSSANAVPVGVADGSGDDDGGQVVVHNNGGGPVDVRGVVLGYYTATPQVQQ